MDTAIVQNNPMALTGYRSAAFQLAMIAAAVALPSLCHFAGAPVTVLLPMHWPVLAAGLFCGWRAGLIAGAASPLIAFALSGMPAGTQLPLMTVELAVYGLAAGLAGGTLKLKPWAAMLIAVFAGRAAYLAASALLMPFGTALFGLLPGVPAALAQVLLLPLAHKKFLGTEV